MSAVLATLLPAVCFDALTLAGLYTLGRRLGGRALAQAFMFAYLLYPFPDLSLMAETNDALIAALCVWTIVVATERPVARGLLITSGPAQFLGSTFGYQLMQRGNGTQFSIWTYMPHVAIAVRPLLAAVLVLLARRSMRQRTVPRTRPTSPSKPLSRCHDHSY